MYNDNDEMYEVSDYDEDIRCREELINEAKAIDPSSQWNDVIREISDLRRRWKRINYWESAYEDTLSEEFDSYIDAFYGKRRESYESNQAAKQDLIDQAIKVSVSNDWRTATTKMNDFMLQWKAIGSAGRDSDDALWEAFNAARQTFFDRKHAHWEDLQKKFETARHSKQDLIVQAAALADSEDWQETSEQLRVLMNQWKAAGSAGKEYEDQLWNEFNASRQKFYERREQYYGQFREQHDANFQEKKDLVDEATTIATKNEYTKENTERMKNLSVEWKQIGFSGNENENQVWKEFRFAMDDYFNGLRQWNDQKHEQWRQRMQDARARKQELIIDQNRQIKRMEQEIIGLLGQRAIDEMEDRIADKKDFIKQLEAELIDIDKTLEQ